MFCTPLAEAPRRAAVRAMPIPPTPTQHLKLNITGSFWGWRWALFQKALWFVVVRTFIVGPLGLSP